MPSNEQLQDKIRSAIPLSDVMQFEIVELTENAISVQAPLAPNINIHGTGFAGSIYSLAVLTGWALVTHITISRGIHCNLVVSEAEIRYFKPVDNDIKCQCEVLDTDINQFIDYYNKKGRSRLKLVIHVGDIQAVLHATFHISALK